MRPWSLGSKEAEAKFKEIAEAYDVLSDGNKQGLTLVHFSAQPEPFLTRTHTLDTR